MNKEQGRTPSSLGSDLGGQEILLIEDPHGVVSDLGPVVGLPGVQGIIHQMDSKTPLSSGAERYFRPLNPNEVVTMQPPLGDLDLR